MKNIPKPNKIFDGKIFIPYYSNSRCIRNIKSKKSISQSHGEEKRNIKFRITKNIYNSNNTQMNLSAYEKADIESNIASQLKSKKYQNILQKDKNITYYLTTENSDLKKQINEKKLKLKDELNKIINESLSLSKSINLSKNYSIDKKLKKNESQNNIRTKNKKFLEILGINIEFNENQNMINIDIDKAWKYINKLSKGKNNIDDILKQKIVNNVLNLKRENGNKLLIKVNRKYSHKNQSKNNHIKKKENRNNELIIKNCRINATCIPYNNNRLRMIDIINRSYICSTNIGDKNDGDGEGKTKS